MLRIKPMTVAIVSTLVLLAAGTFPATVYGSPLLVDQSHVFDPLVTGSTARNIQFFSPIGQSFTPTLSWLDAVELLTEDFGFINGVGATLFVNIHAGTISGPVEGTSDFVFLPDAFSGITRFDFPSRVSLLPGSLYVIEAVVASGDPWGIRSNNVDDYPGGSLILFGGLPIPNEDLWFREGVVPEPSSIRLMSAGILGLLLSAWRRRITTI